MSWASRPFRLFDGLPKADAFARFPAVFPVRVVQRSTAPEALGHGASQALPEGYEFGGEPRRTADFLAATETCGLLVMRDDRLVHETFARGIDAGTQWPLWSITKSIVSLLAGVVLGEAFETSLERPVEHFVPELAASGYRGVSLRHVLQMCSGVRWNENYADPQSDIRRSQASRWAGGSMDAFALSLPAELPPGRTHRYNTADTDVVGRVLRSIGGMPLARLLHERIWQPLGMQDDAFWVVDAAGAEWAGSGLAASLRDLARIGLLCLDGGRWQQRQIVGSAWLRAATQAQAAHLRPGRLYPGSVFGYGDHWWLVPEGLCAIGIYNQFLYVDTRRRVVVAKFSANRSNGSTPDLDGDGFRLEEHVALFRAIAAAG